MNISHLKYFIDSVESGSYSAAARKAGVTQPTISNAIKSLEREFNCKLILSKKDGLALTEAGQSLLTNANTLIGDAERINEEMRRIRKLESGSLSIGIRKNLLTEVMRKLLDQFRKANPRIDIVIRTGDHWELREKLLASKVDFVVDHSSRRTDNEGVEMQFLLDDPLMIFMRPGHPEADKDSLPLSIVKKYPHLYTRRVFDLNPEAISPVIAEGYADAPPSIDIEDMTLMGEIVANSDRDYVFVWTRYLFANYLDYGTLVSVPIDGKWNLPIAVQYRDERLLSHAAQKFIGDLHTECSLLKQETPA